MKRALSSHLSGFLLGLQMLAPRIVTAQIAEPVGPATRQDQEGIPTGVFPPAEAPAADVRTVDGQPRAVLPVHVLTLSGDARFEDAAALTAALKNVLSRTADFRVPEGDHSLDVWAAALECPDPIDSACIDRIAAEIGAVRLAWGTLAVRNGRAHVHLRLWEAGRQVGEAVTAYKATLDDSFDDDLLTISTTLLGQLFGPLRFPVQVAAPRVPRGRLLVDGVPAGELVDGKRELLLSSGVHRITLVASGFAPMSRAVRVELDRPTRVRFAGFTSLPSGSFPIQRSLLRSTPPPRSSHPVTDSDGVLGYVSLALGGALMLGGVIAVSAADTGSDGGSPILPWVLLGAGAATAGVGLYVIAESLEVPSRGGRATLRYLGHSGVSGGRVGIDLEF